MLIHGTCVELDGAGVLLCGPSGSGKSDLALRLITYHDANLVADDQVCLETSSAGLTATVPALLAGLLEVRGVGIVPVQHQAQTILSLVVELCERSEVSRMPEAETRSLDGCAIPLMKLYPHDPSAPAKLRLMLAGVRG
jgi:HPr kinase/phosphorylase